MDTYVFVATGNQSGSTMIQNLLAQCKNAVTLEKIGDNIAEGQHIVGGHYPKVDLMEKGLVWTEMIGDISGNYEYNWDSVKAGWMESWRKHPNFNNSDRVLIEKSPHDVGRIHLLSMHFPNAWFLCQVRNPYVVTEGVHRRTGHDIRRCARHAIHMLKLQRLNLFDYENIIAWKYEDIPYFADKIEELINTLIPGLDDFSFGREFLANSIDGAGTRKFSSFNDKQMSQLSSKDIRIINEEFDAYGEVLRFFDYARIDHRNYNYGDNLNHGGNQSFSV